MKVVMYHYVRDFDSALPYFCYLHQDNFVRQLDWFASAYGLATCDNLRTAAEQRSDPGNSVVLTFDDGVRDHAVNVLPALKARGATGFFFVCAKPYITGALLDVHRIHLLLGRLGSNSLEALNKILRPEMLTDAGREEFRTRPYATQKNEGRIEEFKRILNYFVAYEWREFLLDKLMQETFHCDESSIARDFYMSIDEVRELNRSGMIVGGHSYSHRVFSRLSAQEQEAEIRIGQDFLADLLGEAPSTFCYPYGGAHTFSEETKQLLAGAGVKLAFSVEQRDLSIEDLNQTPLALPRYDCNQFPYGAADQAPEK